MKWFYVTTGVIILCCLTALAVYHKKVTAPNIQTSASGEVNEIGSIELNEHSTFDNCWLVVGGMVYDASGFFSRAENQQLAKDYCGKNEPIKKLPNNQSANEIGSQIGVLAP